MVSRNTRCARLGSGSRSTRCATHTWLFAGASRRQIATGIPQPGSAAQTKAGCFSIDGRTTANGARIDRSVHRRIVSMARFQHLSSMEVLDSRGRPTVKAYCTLDSGVTGAASVPSGASTGSAEALELRDGDPKRYGGLGCQKAVGHINGELRQALVNRDFPSQRALDHHLLSLDGTP